MMLILSLLGRYFVMDHRTLFKCLFRSHMDKKYYVLSHFLTCTWFTCWKKIIIKIIRFFVRTWFLRAVASVIIKTKHTQTFWKHNVFAQILPQKTMGTKAARSPEMCKSRETTLCSQRESEIFLPLADCCSPITRPQSRHLCYLYSSNPAWKC